MTTAEVPEEPPKRSWWRSALRVLLLLAVAIPVVPLIVVISLVAPYVIDDQKLDDIVAAVALDWRDFGREKAEERLKFEVDRRGLGAQIGDDTCMLETTGGSLIVRCAWTVQVAFPFVKQPVPLSFSSRSEIKPDGDLI